MFALHRPSFGAKLISIRLWEFYQGNDFFDCLLSQFIFSSSSPSHPHSSSVLFPLLFCLSFVYCLQWTATRGPKWLPCTPHWWSALRAPRLRWAPPWRRPWGHLKTLCSHPSPESRTESPDQAHTHLFFYNEEILNVSSRTARTWTPREPHLRGDMKQLRGLLGPRRWPFVRIIVCFSCELITPLPPSILIQTDCTLVLTTEIKKKMQCCLWV